MFKNENFARQMSSMDDFNMRCEKSDEQFDKLANRALDMQEKMIKAFFPGNIVKRIVVGAALIGVGYFFGKRSATA